MGNDQVVLLPRVSVGQVEEWVSHQAIPRSALQIHYDLQHALDGLSLLACKHRHSHLGVSSGRNVELPGIRRLTDFAALTEFSFISQPYFLISTEQHTPFARHVLRGRVE